MDNGKKNFRMIWCLSVLLVMAVAAPAYSQSPGFSDNIYQEGTLKPRDSVLKLKVGDVAPQFSLPAVGISKVSLDQFKGRKNVVLSFVPAAWTLICSDQWPGYNIAKNLFDRHNAILLGITVDNIPTLYAWTRQMVQSGEKLWFPVLSDFYPHGAVASQYSVLRSDGVSERALFVINKRGIITYIDVHDINQRPFLDDLAKALEEADKP